MTAPTGGAGEASTATATAAGGGARREQGETDGLAGSAGDAWVARTTPPCANERARDD